MTPVAYLARLVDDIRAHRAEWAAHRRAGGGGAYPGIDRPLTWQQKRAWDRPDRAQGGRA